MSNGKNILVTGGCGFIGSNFIRAALKQSKFPIGRLINLDALTYAGLLSNLQDIKDQRYLFIQGDINDGGLVSRVLREEQIDVILNFAAESHVDRSIDKPMPFVQTNVVGTVNILTTALDYYKTLPTERKTGFRFLQISTDEVYGSLNEDAPPFVEVSNYDPSSPYAASKAAADHFVLSFFKTYGLPVIISHSSNNYGPYQLPEKLIPLMILQARAGKQLPVYGNGKQIRDWLYVEDYVTGLLTLLEKGRVGERYNFGGQEEVANLTVIQRICSIIDELAPQAGTVSRIASMQFVEDRPGHDFRYAMDITKVRNELGWRPVTNFENGLKRTVEWYLKHAEYYSQQPYFQRNKE